MTSTVTSELVIVLECQTDVFQKTSIIIPLNEGLTARNASTVIQICNHNIYNAINISLPFKLAHNV